MKSLFLMRHAKSSWATPGLADSARPLNDRGRAAGGLLADLVVREKISPDAILCSPALRARQTVELVFPDAGESVRFVEEIYGAGPLDVLALLQRLEPEVNSVLIVGHNPTMQKVVLMMSDQQEGPYEKVATKFPTGALARLDSELEWDHLEPGSMRLISLFLPRELG